MKIGKLVKRILLTIGILIFLLLATAILVPVFFKDKILVIVKKELNDQLVATTEFKDLDISILHSFPHLSVSILDLSISGKDSFKNDTLIAAKSIDISLDLMKAINGTYEILNVGIHSPRIHAIVHRDGSANWNITKPDTAAAKPGAASKPFALKLRKYAIENGDIDYNDEQGNMRLSIKNLNHSGSGDFSSDAFTLKTQTTADAITYVMGKIPYLLNVKTLIDLDLQIDNKTNKYSFNTDKIQLNGLKLSTRGYVQMPDTNNILMDISINTPSNNFRDFLSLVPGVYQSNFKDIKTSGSLTLKGNLKGTYNKKQMPGFDFTLGIKDGMFQYPNLPDKVANIQIKLNVSNKDGITDHTVVNLEKCHLELGAQPVDLQLLLKNPVTDQLIDASLNGRIDLAGIQRFIKLEEGTKLAGTIVAGITVKGSVVAAQKKEFDKIDASGTLTFADIAYTAKDYPDGIQLNSMLLTFNPKSVAITNMKGNYQGTAFNGDATVNNLLGYTLHNEALDGTFNIKADKVDVNKLMGTSATPDTSKKAASTVFLVPANLNIVLKAEAGSIKYDNLTLTNVKSTMIIRNEIVNLESVTGNGLDGTIKISGFYSTKTDKKKPDIQLDYTLTGVDIQKTYTSFTMAQKMMPSGKYVSGKVTTDLTMTGKLNPDMTPAMNTLTGKGSMILSNAVLSNFPITDKLADNLHLPQLKSIKLQDSKTFFTFENGRVTIQPYKMKLNGIDAEIAGSHGFDQTVDYGVNMSVPRAMMGTEANAFVDNLAGQAAKKGLNIKVGDKVNITTKITGTITSPKIETNLKNVAGDAVNSIKTEILKKADSVKNVVKDTVKTIAKQVVNQAKDELKKQLLGGGDTTKNKNNNPINNAGDQLKKGLDGLFKKKK